MLYIFNLLSILLCIVLICLSPAMATIKDYPKPQSKQLANKAKPSFKFAQVEIAIHALFILFNAYFAFFHMMPRLVAQHPPPEKNLIESFLTPYIHKLRDSHDEQWEGYRSNLALMVGIMFGWRYFAKFIARIWSFLGDRSKKGAVRVADLEQKLLTSCWLGLAILAFSFRADLILFLGLATGWYFMTKALYRSKLVIPLSWTIVIAVLYLNQKYDHLHFISAWMESYIPIQFFKNSQAPLMWTNILNMNFLKMLSFTMDSHWGDQSFQFNNHKAKCEECSEGRLCFRGRDLQALPLMSLRNYFDYLLFAPTCLAGPPLSYKSFYSFREHPCQERPPFLRWAFLVVFFELYQNYYPVISPSKDQTLLEMSLISLLFLYFIFLKFSVIWKTGRLWSLYYGINVIDNMGRCMFNNYGFEKFWRMWHKGFNHWLIRYLYIPLGGNQNLFSVLSVILFVAFWHDHTIQILLWALILVMFMIPELAIKAYFRSRLSFLYANYWFKYVCAVACAVYIQIICICNLIGFGYGFDNAWVVVERIASEGANFFYMMCVLVSACILMFAVREYEKPQRND